MRKVKVEFTLMDVGASSFPYKGEFDPNKVLNMVIDDMMSDDPDRMAEAAEWFNINVYEAVNLETGEVVEGLR